MNNFRNWKTCRKSNKVGHFSSISKTKEANTDKTKMVAIEETDDDSWSGRKIFLRTEIHRKKLILTDKLPL